MSKVIFEFDGIEENDDIQFVAHRFDIRTAMYELQNYTRHLYNHEERNEIPTEEIVDKINSIMEKAYVVID